MQISKPASDENESAKPLKLCDGYGLTLKSAVMVVFLAVSLRSRWSKPANDNPAGTRAWSLTAFPEYQESSGDYVFAELAGFRMYRPVVPTKEEIERKCKRQARYEKKRRYLWWLQMDCRADYLQLYPLLCQSIQSKGLLIFCFVSLSTSI